MDLLEALDLFVSSSDYQSSLDILQDTIDSLPNTRESAVIIMDAIKCYDIPELYIALFEKAGKFLTVEERTHIRCKYSELFSLEYPFI